jgi:hypothetical protein
MFVSTIGPIRAVVVKQVKELKRNIVCFGMFDHEGGDFTHLGNTGNYLTVAMA